MRAQNQTSWWPQTPEYLNGEVVGYVHKGIKTVIITVLSIKDTLISVLKNLGGTEPVSLLRQYFPIKSGTAKNTYKWNLRSLQKTPMLRNEKREWVDANRLCTQTTMWGTDWHINMYHPQNADTKAGGGSNWGMRGKINSMLKYNKNEKFHEK